tara:strand:+ start:314 stop:430 length:117 start_codon:yes stop_codon:yes gene_type:complete
MFFVAALIIFIKAGEVAAIEAMMTVFITNDGSGIQVET